MRWSYWWVDHDVLGNISSMTRIPPNTIPATAHECELDAARIFAASYGAEAFPEDALDGWIALVQELVEENKAKV